MVMSCHLKEQELHHISRGADGRAVLRSSIREYLCSIAMEGLNIPTTEALAIVASDTDVYREHVESGAIVTRVAKSHIPYWPL